MKPLEFMTFGYLIAFVLPGLIAARALGYAVPFLNLAFSRLLSSPEAAGPIFVVTVAALTAGLILNVIRRVVLDRVYRALDKDRPTLDYRRLTPDRHELFKDAVESTYRPYEFSANMGLALALFWLARVLLLPGALGLSRIVTHLSGLVALLLLVLAQRQHLETYVILNNILGAPDGDTKEKAR